MSSTKVERMSRLRLWLAESGGRFHSSTLFVEGLSGCSLVAGDTEIAADVTIVSCPVSVAITKNSAMNAISTLLGPKISPSDLAWSARQWIACYLCLHRIVQSGSNGDCGSSHDVLKHHAYLESLPSVGQLRTSPYFSVSELEHFAGSNIRGATAEKFNTLQTEWRACLALFKEVKPGWSDPSIFTWDNYLAAATYVSSRAFPSSILSTSPTLQVSDSTEPVLLPGVDSLNHKRGHAVSWITAYPQESASESLAGAMISLKLHTPTLPGQELFNNYGPKPNSELIIAYGFTLPNNPDDTIILQISGGSKPGQKWEIGRNAKGMQHLWEELLSLVVGSDEEASELYEDHLEASAMLKDMTNSLLKRLPPMNDAGARKDMREDVYIMLQHYLEGQYDILQSVLQYAETKEAEAIQIAQEMGIEIILE